MTSAAQDTAGVEVASPAAYSEWDAFVTRHPDGSIYHLSGWKTALEKGFEQIRGHLIFRREGGTGPIGAGLPLYLVRSRLMGNRLVSVPFASFGDALTDNEEDRDALFGRSFKIFSKKKPRFIEVRSRRFDHILKARGFGHSDHFVYQYLSLEGGLDEIYRKAHAKSIRNPIKKALKIGLRLQAGCRRDDVRVYYKIYSAARRKLGLPAMPQEFFFALWDEFWPKGCLTLLLCRLDSQAIGAALLLTFKDTMTIEYGHTLPGYRGYCVDPFLDWQAVRLALERGCKYLSFGRTSTANLGLMTYKRHWGTVDEPLHSYFYPSGSGKAYTRGETSWLSQAVRLSCRFCPPSIYLRLSSRMYRHMG